MFNVVMFGPPGSGKGTHGAKIADKYNLVHVSTGDLFRAEIKNNTELGKQISNEMATGKLLSDEISIAIIKNFILEHSHAHGFVIDGCPRTINQANMLDKFLGLLNTRIHMVISLEVPEDELIKRILRRGLSSDRSDDVADAAKNRLQEFQTKTKPLQEFYHIQGKLTSIDATDIVTNVSNRIILEINKKR